MDKELIDRVWKYCLPKEFKEEVSDKYIYACEHCEESYWYGVKTELECFFGIDNLTSDAEEEVMLTVPRSAVIAEMDKLHKYSYQMPDLQLGLNALTALFGSKCLPDEVKPTESGRVEPQSAEPKFKVGDKVRYKEFVGTVYQIGETDYVIRNLAGGDLIGWLLKESDLEPYTEPQPNCTTKSDTCQPVTDRHHFEENRLHIAAMAMQGLLANGDMRDYTKVAKDALAHADALIAESNKETNKQPK